MFGLLRAGLFFIVCVTAVTGCGLLPTDRPPSSEGRYQGHYSPDPTQPNWHRLLCGTRWNFEGPAQAALAQGHEGVMAKHLASSYRPGKRAAAWRKIKPRRRRTC
jgi:hypothetical protein